MGVLVQLFFATFANNQDIKLKFAKLGNRAFRLRPPLYWSNDSVNENNRNISSSILENLEVKAKKYSKEMCKEISIDYLEETAKNTYFLSYNSITEIVKKLNRYKTNSFNTSFLLSDHSKSIKNFGRISDEWVAVQDIKGRIYYWNKKFNITQWEKPIDNKKQ